MMNLSTQVIGCIGKCTTGLSLKELDRITDNIDKTLTHPQGIQIYEKYLEKRELTSGINCLKLYKTCCDCIKMAESCSESRSDPSLDVLIGHVTEVREIANGLDGVSQIDLGLLKEYNNALNSKSKTDLLSVLQETKRLCQIHLTSNHDSFKKSEVDVMHAIHV